MLWGNRTGKDFQQTFGLYVAYEAIKPLMTKTLEGNVTDIKDSIALFFLNKRALEQSPDGKVLNKEYTFLYDIYFLMEHMIDPTKLDTNS